MEVHFKNKKAKHSIVIKGKQIQFKNGMAQVDDAEAEFIKERGDPDYQVIEPEPKVEKKKAPQKKKSVKKEKE